MKKRIAIIGKGNNTPFKTFKELGFEVWACGTDERDGADRYFEFHNLNYKDRLMIRDCPNVRKYSKLLPLNNSISIMVIQAYIEEAEDIIIVGCPMNANEEMQRQKPALAFVVGYVLGKGKHISWWESPEKDFYLEKCK